MRLLIILLLSVLGAGIGKQESTVSISEVKLLVVSRL